MFSIQDLLGRLLEPIEIVDVGAMFLNRESVPYRALLKKGAGRPPRVIGFEPV